MNQPAGQNPNTPNQQFNHAQNNSNVFANNGGKQNVTFNQTHPYPKRTWAWIALAVLLVIDVVVCYVGSSSYTQGANEDQDMLFSVMAIAFFAATIGVFRICAKDFKQRWL